MTVPIYTRHAASRVHISLSLTGNGHDVVLEELVDGAVLYT